jgi:hypothetical protein|tara:strand:- start:419 stop:682 length:264 start_codon:yes stop_codon:yes gene_type:complete
MNGQNIYHQKNIKFDDAFAEKLLQYSGSEVIINISGGSHPAGVYTIPFTVITDFVVSKSKLQCWKDYGFWTQSNVPKPLRQYFRLDK